MTAKAGGKVIPGFNPLKWLVVAEHPASYRVSGYHLLRGPAPAVEFAKLDGVSREEAGKLMAVPEVKRMHYHSYIVTVARNGESVVFSDPLREQGYLWYPPYFKNFAVFLIFYTLSVPQVTSPQVFKKWHACFKNCDLWTVYVETLICKNYKTTVHP